MNAHDYSAQFDSLLDNLQLCDSNDQHIDLLTSLLREAWKTLSHDERHHFLHREVVREIREEAEQFGDDCCDQCGHSGIRIDQTDADGNTICPDCVRLADRIRRSETPLP